MNSVGDRAREDGFTLVEVLVAFFIAAITLVSALRVIEQGAGWARRGPATALRLEEAASVLDDLIADPRLAPGERGGRPGSRDGWRARITDVTRQVLPASSVRLLRIEVLAGDGTPLLVTLAPGPPPAR